MSKILQNSGIPEALGDYEYGTTFGTQYKRKASPSKASRVRSGAKLSPAAKKRKAKTRSLISERRKRLEKLGNVFEQVGPASVMKYRGKK